MPDPGVKQDSDSGESKIRLKDNFFQHLFSPAGKIFSGQAAKNVLYSIFISNLHLK